MIQLKAGLTVYSTVCLQRRFEAVYFHAVVKIRMRTKLLTRMTIGRLVLDQRPWRLTKRKCSSNIEQVNFMKLHVT